MIPVLVPVNFSFPSPPPPPEHPWFRGTPRPGFGNPPVLLGRICRQILGWRSRRASSPETGGSPTTWAIHHSMDHCPDYQRRRSRPSLSLRVSIASPGRCGAIPNPRQPSTGIVRPAPGSMPVDGRPTCFSASPGPVQPQLDPFAGRVHLVGSLGQHGPPEEFRRGAAHQLVSDVLPDRYDADARVRSAPPGCGLPSSKFRENRSRKATPMVSPGWTRDIRSSQPLWFMVRPLATAEEVKSSRMPWSARISSWVSKFLASSSALLTRA